MLFIYALIVLAYAGIIFFYGPDILRIMAEVICLIKYKINDCTEQAWEKWRDLITTPWPPEEQENERLDKLP
jgi:hypothetical protein